MKNRIEAACPDLTQLLLGIYTDWANHYLERSRYKRYIQDLQSDISDGVLLADVIDAVGMLLLWTAHSPEGRTKRDRSNERLEREFFGVYRQASLEIF
ncbi:hypothetical protein HPB48_017349 [Haemaphysalis longicornis]|uniref:Calponin-homology (CH) domain-containing protein n=1 Tax=Haemaphysalis longicornis TaxID=44386 RepID=A0A9J6GY46_HAELO|nr:hypothetical protein HPB48_017349 [Haemaphysalis longicornis]